MKKKRRRKRIKPKNMEVTHDPGGKKVTGSFNPIETLQIVEWCPDDKAEMPPEALWVILTDYLEDRHVLRFTGPDTLGWFIEELIAYRKRIWKDAEPINHEVSTDDVAFQLRKMDKIPLEEDIMAKDGHFICSQCNAFCFRMTNGNVNVLTYSGTKERRILAAAIRDLGIDSNALPAKVGPCCTGEKSDENET